MVHMRCAFRCCKPAWINCVPWYICVWYL